MATEAAISEAPSTAAPSIAARDLKALAPADIYTHVRGRHKDYYETVVERRKELGELLRIVGDALKFSPPLYLNSILGPPWTWLPPYDRFSEFSIVNPLALGRAIQYLLDITIPALPISPPENAPVIKETLFWRPSQVLFRPDHEGNPYSFADEAWIFVNGIATNPAMADINADLLVHMFHRPLTIIQNATDSVGVDLAESAIGKAWETLTEAACKAYPFVLNALHDPNKKRVVVVCHSQGTIIMGNVLRALLSEEYRDKMMKGRPVHSHYVGLHTSCHDGSHNLDLLRKLEIYAFANAAEAMPYAPPDFTTDSGHRVPWIENFGNEYDLVARLGMLAPHKKKHGICIDGPNFVRVDGWGHCLNDHYLKVLRRYLDKPGSKANPYEPEKGSASPRLYEYYQGAKPDPY